MNYWTKFSPYYHQIYVQCVRCRQSSAVFFCYTAWKQRLSGQRSIFNILIWLLNLTSVADMHVTVKSGNFDTFFEVNQFFFSKFLEGNTSFFPGRKKSKPLVDEFTLQESNVVTPYILQCWWRFYFCGEIRHRKWIPVPRHHVLYLNTWLK
jgi:hypothetical protein